MAEAEYSVRRIAEVDELEPMLNEAWTNGWSLVQVIPLAGWLPQGTTSSLLVVFKRRKA
jgi:hypothetical protein